MMAALEECSLKKTPNHILGALIVNGTKIQSINVLLKENPNPSIDVLVTN
jgi:hypothetical protein